MKQTLKWIFRTLFYEDIPENQPKEIATAKSIAPENYGAVIDPWAEIVRLKAALAEALASLDQTTSDCILMALASKRALAKFKDSDDEPCRWCGSEEDIHEEHCPSHVLVDIGFVGLIGDEVMRRLPWRSSSRMRIGNAGRRVMPDELKPCPNPMCPEPTELNVGHAGGCWWVSCCCGVRSPAITRDRKVIETRESAVATWNAMPRSPLWTEYDGTESTLPPILADILVEFRDGTRFCCKHDADGAVVFANDESFRLTKGSRWMPWPEGGE